MPAIRAISPSPAAACGAGWSRSRARGRDAGLPGNAHTWVLRTHEPSWLSNSYLTRWPACPMNRTAGRRGRPLSRVRHGSNSCAARKPWCAHRLRFFAWAGDLRIAWSRHLQLVLGCAAAAFSRRHPPAAASPFEGNGFWVWYVSDSGGSGAALGRAADRRGLDAVYVKSGDGVQLLGPVQLRGWSRRSTRVASMSAPGSSSTATIRSGRPESRCACRRGRRRLLDHRRRG